MPGRRRLSVRRQHRFRCLRGFSSEPPRTRTWNLEIKSPRRGRCRALHALAKPAYLNLFLCPGLQSMAGGHVSGGVRVVSGEVRRQWITRRRFLAIQMCQMLGGPPNRRGEAPTRDFHLRLRFPGPFTRADIHAGLTHVVLTTMRRTGDYGRLWPCRTRAMHDPASGLRRISPSKLSEKGFEHRSERGFGSIRRAQRTEKCLLGGS
jgi:hypothetical protein